MRRLITTLSLVLASLLFASVASAQRAPEVRWQPHWDQVRTAQYVYMGLLVGVEGVLEYGPVRSGGPPRVKGAFFGDEAVQSLIRIDDSGGAATADLLSDLLWYPSLSFPLWADALGAALIGHGQGEVAWQLTAISIQALLTTTLVARILHITVRRQRPIYDQAEKDGVEADTGLARTLSFPGGHAATAWAGAGLTCSFHRNLPLFGGGFFDDAACPSLITVAAATSILRMMIDAHYFSDTIVGSGIGFTIGYFFPQLLHFGSPKHGDRVQLVPWSTRHSAGLSLTWST